MEVQGSAQELDRGGAFEIDRAELAFLDRVDEETMDSILLALEAPDVALIVDGRCATFKARAKPNDQLFRKREKSRQEAGRCRRKLRRRATHGLEIRPSRDAERCRVLVCRRLRAG